MLAIKYGHNRIIQPTKSLLHTFLKQTKIRNLNETILYSVAFYITAKNHQVKKFLFFLSFFLDFFSFETSRFLLQNKNIL